MYTELGRYLREMAKRKELLTDGDFITGLVGGVCAAVTFAYRPDAMDGIQEHFGNLLSAASIVFGFALTTLTFYISSVAKLDRRAEVRRISDKLVDWHVWTVLSLFFLIGWLLALWLVDSSFSPSSYLRVAAYSGFAFLLIYCGGQVVNHALTLRWFYYRRMDLQAPRDDRETTRNVSPSTPDEK